MKQYRFESQSIDVRQYTGVLRQGYQGETPEKKSTAGTLVSKTLLVNGARISDRRMNQEQVNESGR
jgi:hypothetical protein